MAPQPSGGTSATAAKPPQPSLNGIYNNFNNRNNGGGGDELRCRCCPYGFHIDLDFVKFAENVTAGNDQAHKWNTQPRRTTRRRGNYSVDESATTLPRPIITRDTNSFDTPDEWLLSAGNATSPMESNMSQSTNGGFYSAADDDLLPTQDIPSYNNYLAKNKSDSIVARLIGELNGIDNARKPPIPPPLSSSTPYPGQDFVNHKPQKSWHGATSANTEIHEILSRQQPTYSTTREFSKTVTSAPSSPTPVKTYHSAVAQSAARKAQTQSHSSATTSKHPITPPRRYFDSARPRVLSPEPAARDRSLAPTALRTSNFHSRTYYSPTATATTTTTENRHVRVPYRGATSSLSTGLDFNSFASVRRQRTSTDERNRTLSPVYNRQTGGSRLDGYTSESEYRTAYRYEMSPPPLPPRSHPPPLTPTTPTKIYSYGSSTILQKQQPENVFENLKKPDTVERGVDAFEIQKAAPKPVLQQHQESQTRIPPEQRHVSTLTDTEEEKEELSKTELSTQITQTSKIDQSTIGCNTDKIPEEPFQPKKDFSVEFQFALGHEPEHQMNPDEIAAMFAAASKIPKETKEQGSDAIKTALFSIGMNTDKISMVDKACMPMPPPVKPKTAEKGVVTDSSEDIKKDSATIETQTEKCEEEEKEVTKLISESITIETQTDNDWIEIEIERRMKAEKAERKSVDKITETEEEESGEFIMITCTKCEQSSLSNGHEHYEKIVEHQVDGAEAEDDEADEEEEEVDPSIHTQTDSIGDHESGFSNSSTDLEEFEKLEQSIQEQEKQDDHDIPPEPMFRHSLSSEPEYCSDHDRESLDTVSIKTMIMVDSNNVEEKKQQPVDSSKVEAIRKLLTEPSRSPFSRESGAYRSYRSEKAKTTDDLDFITDKHNLHDDTGEPSTPSTNSQSALTDMVKLKKEIQFLSLVPEPVAAKIPRPKVSKYNLTAEEASTPDEEEEAADRLTPLRSELRSLAAWSHGGGPFGPAQDIGYRRFAAAQNAAVSRTPIEDDEVVGEIQNSGASSESDSEGTYEMSDKEDAEEIIEFEMSEPLKEALETLNDHLKKPDDVATQAVDWAQRYVQHTWLKMATKRKATAGWVEKFLDALESYEPALIELIVNFADNNGNTALHYAVSHENYDLVSVMLDSKVCNVDNNNIAGYSPVMLGSLCEIHNETQSTIIQRLFEIGNVNAKAIKHGQTALQLAASHGRVETTQLLLNCGADVNIQDVDGSTALMCAAEHGHKEIAKMLLKCSNIDASLTDCDNQTALSIAVQQGHKALAVLIYAHLNFHRYQSSENSSAV